MGKISGNSGGVDDIVETKLVKLFSHMCIKLEVAHTSVTRGFAFRRSARG